MLVGILSGLVPALRASRLDPVEALRYEWPGRAGSRAPEYGGNAAARFHILGHVLIGMVGFSLVGWLVASIVMWVTKRVSGKGPVQTATA